MRYLDKDDNFIVLDDRKSKPTGSVVRDFCHIYGCRNLITDTHREKAPSFKAQVLTGSVNMDIWVVGTLNQLFIRGS